MSTTTLFTDPSFDTVEAMAVQGVCASILSTINGDDVADAVDLALKAYVTGLTTRLVTAGLQGRFDH